MPTSYQRTCQMPQLGGLWALTPNTALELTPLRGPEIVPFLNSFYLVVNHSDYDG
jgi:hypothetical protein